MNEFLRRITNLLSVKSIVTITLTAVFAYMAVANSISQDFMTIYAVIIAFYFGTQSQSTKTASSSSDTTGATDSEDVAQQ